MSVLVYADGSKSLDSEASEEWGLNPFALVEAAGRACTCAFFQTAFEKMHKHRLYKRGCSCVVLAGKGNNAADALVMLRTLIIDGYTQASDCSVFCVQPPASSPNSEKNPLSAAVLAIQRLGVPVQGWEPDTAAAALARADVIIDGIAGTGLTGPLRGAALDMVETLNALRRDKRFGGYVVSIDVPSGNFDGWQPGNSIVAADATLAIEPRKLCLYTPSARPYAGTIIPVKGIFPPALVEKYREAELVEWDAAAARIPPVSKTAYKYERGLVEIRAGSPGAAGAARLAALGAQAAGAGLVRLIVDASLYPVIAPACSGVMVIPDDAVGESRLSPSANNAALLGPGWGAKEDGYRMRILQAFLPLEQQGIPLILDAGAIPLAKDIVFHGNVIITPHPGEFSVYTGIPKEEILANPIPILRRFAAEKKVHILFKSHVLYIAAPDGRLGVVDGMKPLLATGGTGDTLAGFCAAIAARVCGTRATDMSASGIFDAVCAAAALVIRAAESENVAGCFVDPAEIARAAAAIAGAAWLTEAPV